MTPADLESAGWKRKGRKLSGSRSKVRFDQRLAALRNDFDSLVQSLTQQTKTNHN